MQADHSHLLSQLQDIHSAGDPGWWPPAPGWWLVALVLLLALAFLFRAVASKLAALRRRREWLLALDRLNREHDLENDPHAWLAALNRLFRAVALKAFPGTACAGLQGDEWVAFIRSLMPEAPARTAAT